MPVNRVSAFPLPEAQLHFASNPLLDPKEQQSIKTAEELIDKVQQLLPTKDYQAMLAHLNKAVQVAPKYVEAKYWLGMLHIEMADYDAAVSVLEAALKDDPRNLAVRWNLGKAAFNAKQHKKALDVCNRLLQISPNSQWHETARELVKLAEYMLAGGDLKNIIEDQNESSPPEAKLDLNDILALFLKLNTIEQYQRMVTEYPDMFGEELLEGPYCLT